MVIGFRLYHYLPLEKDIILHLNRIESPLHKNALCQAWLNWPSDSFKFQHCIFAISYLSPLPNKTWPLIWTNLNPFYLRMLWVIISWNWPSGSEEKYFLNCQCSFHYFVIMSLWKRAWPFIWTNSHSQHPRMLCAKFSLNCPGGSGFLNFVIWFLPFRNYLPLKKGEALHLNILESPLSKKNIHYFLIWSPGGSPEDLKILNKFCPMILKKKNSEK